MRDWEKEKEAFEQRLRQVLEACSESDSAYEHWLGRNGLDRDMIRRAAGGAALRSRPELKQAFESMKREIEEEKEEQERGSAAGREKTRAVDGGAMPRWAIRV
ncbi:MAG: hypothetical protein ABIJ56_05430 [Pseudomonadota bacterium]